MRIQNPNTTHHSPLTIRLFFPIFTLFCIIFSIARTKKNIARLHNQRNASVVGLLLVVALSFVAVGSARNAASVLRTVTDIGVEHLQPLSLRFDVGTLQGVAVIEIISESNESVHVSVPSAWILREVRNIPIADVTSTEASFGFTRWVVPAGASLSFRSVTDPGTLLLHNPSGIPLKASIRRADLDTGIVETDSVLIHEGTGEL